MRYYLEIDVIVEPITKYDKVELKPMEIELLLANQINSDKRIFEGHTIQLLTVGVIKKG
jgi:hypothetical protein